MPSSRLFWETGLLEKAVFQDLAFLAWLISGHKWTTRQPSSPSSYGPACASFDSPIWLAYEYEQADEDDELSESQTAEGQSSESERESEHEEPPAEKIVHACTKKSKGQSKSAIVKTVKRPGTELLTRARADGKSPIGVPESLNPDRLSAKPNLQESDAAQYRTAQLAEIHAENATQTNRIESYFAANEGLFEELLRDNEEARLGFSVLTENLQRKLRVANEPDGDGGRLR